VCRPDRRGLSAGCIRRAAEAVEHRSTPVASRAARRRGAHIGKHGGRFVFAETGNPRTFKGMMANETSSTDITVRNLFITLVDYDQGSQKIVPMLAKSWEVSPDGLTWTFHLRQGAKFSDGQPITSADVLFSSQVALDEIACRVRDQLNERQAREFSRPTLTRWS
jgi:ABC-type transport system substrate-binding protein